ncbi:hypothetical protein BC03BB108_C0214 (plasmid) [Bacillus cereus 03BB108]|nr:hypothetical protein BC03BB108_C0214 [Bacillus cereus 03BB108]
MGPKIFCFFASFLISRNLGSWLIFKGEGDFTYEHSDQNGIAR